MEIDCSHGILSLGNIFNLLTITDVAIVWKLDYIWQIWRWPEIFKRENHAEKWIIKLHSYGYLLQTSTHTVSRVGRMAVAVNFGVLSVLTCKTKNKYIYIYIYIYITRVKKSDKMSQKKLLWFRRIWCLLWRNILHKTKVELIPLRMHKMALYSCCTICPGKYNGKQISPDCNIKLFFFTALVLNFHGLLVLHS